MRENGSGVRAAATGTATRRRGGLARRVRRRSRLREVALGGVLLLGCREAPEIVSLPPPEVSVSQPVERSLSDSFETTGQTVAVESVEIRARVSGYLTKVSFRDGADVKAGDELFIIDPRPYEAEVLRCEAEVARWEATRRKAVADYERNKRLLPKGAASEKDVESSLAARDSAEAEIQAARAQLRQAHLDLEFTRVTAPIAGQLSRTNVTIGNLIQASPTGATLLTTLVSVDPIHVYFDIDERTVLERIRTNREEGRTVGFDTIPSLRIPVEIALAGDHDFSRRGVLDFADNRVDPATGTLKARAVFENADRSLTPGLFARVRVPLGEPKPWLLVPERAIGTDQGTKFLLVVSDANVVEYRAVTLGPRADDGLRVVSEGLQPAEWVIVNGIQRVRPGITVTPQKVAVAQSPASPASPAPVESAAAPAS